ncbi:class I SAM-dependent methyltransferase [Sphaerisporangium sp. NPDC049002]|uniref:class I SAM-dependent methyltransferase n=1 Tax=unclassified Sphaerisporangium TaxID=2630420 RepID=UPI0033D099D9
MGSGFRSVYDLNARALNVLLPKGGRLLDLGSGSGQALAYLAGRRPDVTITGLDLSPTMLSTGRAMLRSEHLDKRVSLVRADITAIPDEIAEQHWDAVSCVWTLHQLPDVEILSAALRQISVLRKSHGAAVWILDFQRLRDPRTMPDVIDVAEPGYPAKLRQDGIDSEAAAFTRDELQSHLASAGLGDLESGLASPIPYLHAFWSPGAERKPQDETLWNDLRQTGRARLDTALLRRGFHPRPF